MSQIVLSKPIQTAVIPKPTKSEVVKALVELKLRQHKAETEAARESAKKIRVKVEAKIVSRAIRERKTLSTSVYLGRRQRDTNGTKTNKFDDTQIRITFESLPDDLCKEVRELMELEDKASKYLCPKVCKQQIQAALDNATPPEERVDLLLSNKDSRAALEAMLKAISK